MDGGCSGDSDDQTQVEQLVSCFGGCKSHSTGITATSPEKKKVYMGTHVSENRS